MVHHKPKRKVQVVGQTDEDDDGKSKWIVMFDDDGSTEILKSEQLITSHEGSGTNGQFIWKVIKDFNPDLADEPKEYKAVGLCNTPHIVSCILNDNANTRIHAQTD